MPVELYDQVVLPCWKSNGIDDDSTASPSASGTGVVGREAPAAPEHSFELRPTFAELTSRLGRLCTELQLPSRRKRSIVSTTTTTTARAPTTESQDPVDNAEGSLQPTAPYASVGIKIPSSLVSDNESDGGAPAAGAGVELYQGVAPPFISPPMYFSLNADGSAGPSQGVIPGEYYALSEADSEMNDASSDLTARLYARRYGGGAEVAPPSHPLTVQGNAATRSPRLSMTDPQFMAASNNVQGGPQRSGSQDSTSDTMTAATGETQRLYDARYRGGGATRAPSAPQQQGERFHPAHRDPNNVDTATGGPSDVSSPYAAHSLMKASATLTSDRLARLNSDSGTGTLGVEPYSSLALTKDQSTQRDGPGSKRAQTSVV
jgi:hypothetical protein